MMNKSIKLKLASKIFEIREFNQGDKEEWYMKGFWKKSPNIHDKFNYEQNQNDPPDYIISSNLHSAPDYLISHNR